MRFPSRSPSSNCWNYLLFLPLLISNHLVGAIQLDVNDPSSIKSAASIVAHGMMSYYQGNLTGQTPGLLPYGYYWWECGAMFGQLIDYWYYTGDTTWNAEVTAGMLFQVGPNNDYMPPNQTDTEGNDDQIFWAFAAMSAAENKFPDPPSNEPQWLALAQAVFNEQTTRWDTATCDGGLRWQIFSFNSGYDYKQAVANGGLMQLGARLARYTGNATYADWAEKVWDWVSASSIYTPTGTIYDGTSTTVNCSTADQLLWSYNQGVYLLAAATMYNYTNGSSTWQERTELLLNATAPYFSTASGYDNVITESTCEPTEKCDTDEVTFKGFTARWMAQTMQMAPFTADTILPKLQASTSACATSCNGGSDGVTCGTTYLKGTWDGTYGAGQQLSALGVIQASLITQVGPPVTQDTGGTSKGNAAAGNSNSNTAPSDVLAKVTGADKAGAGIMTTLIILGVIGGTWWLLAGPG